MEQIMEKAAEAFNELSKTNERVTTSNVSAYMKDKYDITLPKNTKLKTIFEKMGYEIHTKEDEPSIVYIVGKKNVNDTAQQNNAKLDKPLPSKSKINKSTSAEKPKLFQIVYIPDIDLQISKLARKASLENWGKGNNVLYNYFLKYFEFIYENPDFPNLISYNDDKSKMCFHTGLYYADSDSPIYAYCEIYKEGYKFKDFCSGGHFFLKDLNLPKILETCEDFQEKIVFNPDLDVRFNDEHVSARAKQRLKHILDFDVLQPKIFKYICEGELNFLKKRKNEVVNVVPAIYNNEICFFIPLRLTKDNNTNAILAVQREIGPDGKHYNVVKTLLLLEENIYQMARTAQKINIGWLSNFLLD
ncbi:DUF3825 domain-containing protein [Campylobacter helveticus]|uniref:DUF3825 domain-containing protein n=1 Tax=Campylobacter helveticus TaxID=28898 RepID=UPI0022EB997F|nr:DUF3825 domain-containing protein [Campylobacter helveticus]